jgi:hypothetical protein
LAGWISSIPTCGCGPFVPSDVKPVRRAADETSDVAELWRTTQNNRYAGARMVVNRVQTLGPLAPHLDADSATDVLWILNDPTHYASLVLERGWPEEPFRSWLAATMKHGLLPG